MECGVVLWMNYEMYTDLIFSNDLNVVDFESTGEKGRIPKRVSFRLTMLANVYNMAYGDLKDGDIIDDHSRTNNGDRNKILATLANIIDIYTDKYPKRMIYFKGSTKERTRLYRMAVGLHLTELSRKYVIYAEIIKQGEFVLFRKNMSINAFLIKRKKS